MTTTARTAASAATVVDLDSRRRRREREFCCGKHAVLDLVARVQSRYAALSGELLVPLDVLAELVDDVTRTAEAATADTGEGVTR